MISIAIEGRVAKAAYTDPLQGKMQPPVLYGPSKKRRLARGRESKLALLRDAIKRCGINNPVMNALSGREGYAYSVRNLVNRRYMELSKKYMAPATCAALHWDGAMYAGLNINIGGALDPINLVGCHFQPIVPIAERQSVT